MREQRQELARLARVAVDRPRWQLAFTVVVSVWSLAWVVGQVSGAPSPLDVLPARWAGLPTGWLDAAAGWCAGRTGPLAVAGGLLWAMTSPRRQASAPLGWLAVMAAAQDVGYDAVKWALLVLAVFLAVMGLVSIPGRRAFVVDRVVVMPKDVARAGATAVALSAVVPLVAPGLALARLVAPYLTRPPRPARTPIARPASAERTRPAGTPGDLPEPLPVPRAGS
ncbi:hypothetical protein [Saccharothrix longispora]|uniref:hypothetical protein n=1 Tax=Saccharothrix longispora TaxID=33920 RepID=UPI0028FDB7ED|nr:hypothetical protein [Saccharothrix longispora]MBY8850585.1 hypothetical protein [Saccharothrix sp. MB29]MDU0293566.1 hypothetical protein [Saccharothrix longispora]